MEQVSVAEGSTVQILLLPDHYQFLQDNPFLKHDIYLVPKSLFILSLLASATSTICLFAPACELANWGLAGDSLAGSVRHGFRCETPHF